MALSVTFAYQVTCHGVSLHASLEGHNETHMHEKSLFLK